MDSFSRMESDVYTNRTVEGMMICYVVVEMLAGSEFKPRFPTSLSRLYGAYVLRWGFLADLSPRGSAIQESWTICGA